MKAKVDLKALLNLKANSSARSTGFTEEEGYEIIRSYRRGVSDAAIAEVLGTRGGTAVRSRLGTWAIHHCKCVPK